MIKLAILALFSGMAVFTSGFTLAQTSPYSGYEKTQKLVTEIDWRLLQIGIQLAPKEAYIFFDKSSRLFKVEAWVTTSEVARTDTKTLRDDLVAKVELAKALLGRYFPEFKARGSRDLRAQILLGRETGEAIAAYDGETIRFTDAYYEFLREAGKR
jgi:hypothetical protein